MNRIYKDPFDQDTISTMVDFKVLSPLNEALCSLYEGIWPTYLNIPKTIRDKYGFPYLIAPSPLYEKAAIKVMLVGKEPNDWGHGTGEFLGMEPSVKELMDLFDYWVNGNGGTVTDANRYPHFWEFYANNLKYPLEKADDESRILCNVGLLGKARNIPIGCVASNIFKVSFPEGGGLVRDISNLFKGLFQDEIEILRPNIIIATVYNKDDRSYRKIIDETFGLNTYSLNKDWDLEFEYYKIGDIFLYLTRHPQGMSNEFKGRLLEHIKATILSNFFQR